MLAGRYRLDDLLTENDGARFWRATDTILARSVAIHAVPSDDERAPGLLDAARVSATVTDPHLLRVLDCDDESGITWVVNEWGDGVSLDLMLQQGTLPPSRAAWLTREVADAIAAGHAQGIAHGRLNPEAVLVTHAGAVKLIGYVVDASLQRSRPPDPLYGELDEREADVINLAGILYAGADRPVARRRPVRRTQGAAGGSPPAAPPPGARRRTPHPGRDLRAGAAQGGLPARDADRDRPGDRRRAGRLPRRLRPGRAARHRRHARRADRLDPPRRPDRRWPTCSRPRPSHRTTRGAQLADRRVTPVPESTSPSEPSPDADGRQDEHPGLPRAADGPESLDPAPGAARGGRTAAALRGPARAPAVRHHRAPGPRAARPRRPMPPAQASRSSHTAAAWAPRRRRAARSTRPRAAPVTPARGSGPSPTRTRPRTTSTPARRDAAGCGRRSWSACSSCWSWRWPSRSTAAARTATPRPGRSEDPSQSASAQRGAPLEHRRGRATSTPTATRPRRTPTPSRTPSTATPPRPGRR